MSIDIGYLESKDFPDIINPSVDPDCPDFKTYHIFYTCSPLECHLFSEVQKSTSEYPLDSFFLQANTQSAINEKTNRMAFYTISKILVDKIPEMILDLFLKASSLYEKITKQKQDIERGNILFSLDDQNDFMDYNDVLNFARNYFLKQMLPKMDFYNFIKHIVFKCHYDEPYYCFIKEPSFEDINFFALFHFIQRGVDNVQISDIDYVKDKNIAIQLNINPVIINKRDSEKLLNQIYSIPREHKLHFKSNHFSSWQRLFDIFLIKSFHDNKLTIHEVIKILVRLGDATLSRNLLEDDDEIGTADTSQYNSYVKNAIEKIDKIKKIDLEEIYKNALALNPNPKKEELFIFNLKDKQLD